MLSFPIVQPHSTKEVCMASEPLEVAMWRYEKIMPLLDHCLCAQTRSEMINQMSEQSVVWPSGKHSPIQRSTIYNWLKRYNDDPRIESLLPKTRTLPTMSKSSIDPLWVVFALGLIEEQPARSLFVLCKRIQFNFSLPKPPSRSALHRALRKERRYNAARNAGMLKLRTRFAASEVHQIWHGDAKADFKVTFIDGSTRKVRILSLLDDYSRYILSAQIVDSESLRATTQTFFNAASRFGLPQSFYADRGSAYDSYLFRQALALLGVRRINTKPRNPSAHGKIEAYHRPLHNWFVNELPYQQISNIAHLQGLLDATIEVLYHQHTHRELKMTPAAAFNNTISQRSVSIDRLHEAFLEYHSLIPEKKTGNVRLKGTLFHTPKEYLVPRKTLQYAVDLIDPLRAYLIDSSGKNIRLETAIKVAKVPSKDSTHFDNSELLGSLSPLLETYRGRTLQAAQSGFGLPEIYSLFTQALNRTVPVTESEATTLALWVRTHGPFSKFALTNAINEVIKKIGGGRPLRSILDELVTMISIKKGSQQ
jgi:putative transposase